MRDWIVVQNLVHEFFTALNLLAGKDPKMPLLLGIGGVLLFTTVGDLCAAWIRSVAGSPARELSAGFSLQKGGPVATHYEQGNAFMRRGDFNRAIESFSKALRLNPRFADALIERSAALLEKGDYDNALADLSEAVYLDPKSARGYYRRGGILGTRGDYAGAIADYDRSLRLDPGQKKVREARERAMARLAETG
jgi:tetratricopeptide (TPR) repeat protein